MTLAIMQPYFFPYIGYFQLMNAVDEFVVYDNIQYTKKGWVSRNRILTNGKDALISIPLRKDSDYLDVRDRYLADNWPLHRVKVLNRIRASYTRAPEFDHIYHLVEKCLYFDDANLFKFILNSLNQVREYLAIPTPLVVSSTILIDHALKAEKKVIAICKARNASRYVNSIGGIQLYGKDEFESEGIDLQFLQKDEFTYAQFGSGFVPSLSIVDVMMFNSKDVIRQMLQQYRLS